MKKIMFMTISLTALSLLAFANSAECPSRVSRITKITHLTESDLNEIMQGNRPETTVELPAQTVLPIHFFLKGDLVNLIEREGTFGEIVLQQTLYANYSSEGLRLSSNLADWKPFLEFITGTSSISFNIQEGQPFILFGSEVNKRL